MLERNIVRFGVINGESGVMNEFPTFPRQMILIVAIKMILDNGIVINLRRNNFKIINTEDI